MKTLRELAEDAIETVESGYYSSKPSLMVAGGAATTNYTHNQSQPGSGSATRGRRSVVQAIKISSGRAIICEIKFASPSAGRISGRYDQVSQIAKEMEAGGAAGLSVLTEPKNFNGSIANLVTASESTNLPVIMKDIVISKEQIVAARSMKANAILLIQEIFSEGYTKDKLSLYDAVKLAKEQTLEVILETHTKQGLIEASKFVDCDIIGINNRDLKTFNTTINTTLDLLGDKFAQGGLKDRLVTSESGFENPGDVSNLINVLRARGLPVPKAFLIGTSIMKSEDIRSTVRGFVEAAAKD